MVNARAILLLVAAIGCAQAASVQWSEIPEEAVVGVEMPLVWQLQNSRSQPTNVDLADNLDYCSWGEARLRRNDPFSRGPTEIIIPTTFHKTGTFTLPEMSLTLRNGQQLAVPGITITVRQARADLTGDAFAEISCDPPHAIPGQAVSVHYRLYLHYQDDTQLHWERSNGIGVQIPKAAIPEGDWRVNESITWDREKNPWRLYHFQRQLVFPGEGEYQFSGQQPYAGMQVSRRQAGNSFFESRQEIQRFGTVAIKPFTLSVGELPSEGRPDNFRGLIGPISCSATLEHSSIRAGTGTTLTVTLAGQLVDLYRSQDLRIPADPDLRIEAFDENSGAQGERLLRYSVSALHTGTYTIPSIEVPYYDPSSERYRVARSSPLTLQVLPGRTLQTTITGLPSDGQDSGSQSLTTVATLPGALRGQAAANPRPLILWQGLMVGLILGLGAGIVRLRPWQRGERISGRQAVRALRDGHYDTANRLLHSLRETHDDAQVRAAIDRCLALLEAHRFGHGASDPIDPTIIDAELQTVERLS